MWKSTEDATVWVGYSDFLTTLVVLFFVIAVVFSVHGSDARPGYVAGTIMDAATGAAIPGCQVFLGEEDEAKTDEKGGFQLAMLNLVVKVRNSLSVECPDYPPHLVIVGLEPADTTRADIRLSQYTTVEVSVLPGDALFESGRSTLRQEAVEQIVEVGRSLDLGPGQVVVVQGHTDDTPFAPGVRGDNWTLSGERAAAAAGVLVDPRYGGLSECQVAIIGFGPSRPIAPLHPTDDAETVMQKRATNRRIEFRRIDGAHLLSGECDEQ